MDFSDAVLLLTGVAPGGKTLVVLVVPGLSSDDRQFFGQVLGSDYPCYRDDSFPERLFCIGPQVPPQKEQIFKLYVDRNADPLFEGTIYIQYTPTPSLQDYQNSGRCEVEPLYQPEHPQLTAFQDPSRAGCYAITCWSVTGAYKCGTEDSCVRMPSPPCP